MRKFYFYSAVAVAVVILVMAFAELGSSCSFTLLDSSSYVTFTLLQMAGLGAIFGGLAISFWRMPPPSDDDETEELPEKKEEKMSTKIEE